MIDFKVIGSTNPLLYVTLDRGERFFAEADAMVSMSGSMELRGLPKGGILNSLMRKIANNESFFLQEFRATEDKSMALLAPKTMGDIYVLDLNTAPFVIADGAYLASTDGVDSRSVMQNMGNALLGQTGGFFLSEVSGHGKIAVSGAGAIREITIQSGKSLIVDNGHVVAWESTLRYEATLLKGLGGNNLLGRIVNSQTTGEGLVLRFSGYGKLLVSSRKAKY